MVHSKEIEPFFREPDVGSFTRRRIERMIDLVVAMGSMVLGVQALILAVNSEPGESVSVHMSMVVIVFVPWVAMLSACVFGQGIRPAAGTFFFAYLLVILVWPIIGLMDVIAQGSESWLWYLVSVGTVSTVLIFPVRWQVVGTIAIPLIYGVGRLVRGDLNDVGWLPVLFDVSFALLLGSVFVTLGWVFRELASSVDAERARTVSAYAATAAVAAREQERVAIAALMHDSVLAALIAADRARTPREKTLAVAMAQDALTRLANAEQGIEEGSDAPVAPHAIALAIQKSGRNLGYDAEVSCQSESGARMIPGRVAKALTLAATQAVVNALQHAGGKGLHVGVVADADLLLVEVIDAGAGFDLREVAEDRLGVRASILARVAAVGGVARIESDPRGTRVRLEWRAG